MGGTDVHGIEVEAKWAPVGRGGTARLLRALSIREGTDARVAAVSDVYVDTREGALRRAGLSCRVRTRAAGGYEVTLKAVRRAGPAGAFARAEWTVETEHPSADPRLLPDGGVRRVVKRLAADSPLVPFVRVRGTRSTWVRTPKKGLTVEVTLDRVRISGVRRPGGRRSATVTEVEAEKRTGDDATFLAWQAAVRRAAGARAVARSKFERGLALAGLRAPAARALALSEALLREPVKPSDPAGAAAAESLGRLAAALSAAFASARRGGVEGVHDVRTTSRRVRAVVDAFRAEVGKEARRDLLARLRSVRRAAGPVRDLDVLDEAVVAADVEPAAGVARLRRAIGRARVAALRRLRTTLASARVADLPLRVAALSARAFGAPSPPFAVAGAARLFLAFEDALAVAVALRNRARDARAEDLHRLRIATKRARYAAEAFSHAFGKPVSRFASAASDLQEALGAIQDARVERAVLSRFASSVGGGAAKEAAAAVCEALDEKARDARRDVDGLIEKALSPAVLRDLASHVVKRAGSSGARALPAPPES